MAHKDNKAHMFFGSDRFLLIAHLLGRYNSSRMRGYAHILVIRVFATRPTGVRFFLTFTFDGMSVFVRASFSKMGQMIFGKLDTFRLVHQKLKKETPEQVQKMELVMSTLLLKTKKESQ